MNYFSSATRVYDFYKIKVVMHSNSFTAIVQLYRTYVEFKYESRETVNDDDLKFN